MTTLKPQVLSYIHKEVYERLVEFKEKHNIKSLSSAVEFILADYFSLHTPNISIIANKESTLSEKVEALSNKYLYLVEVISIIQGNIASASAPMNRDKFTVKDFGIRRTKNLDTSNQRDSSEETESSPEISNKALTGIALAARLNSYPSTISNKRSKPEFSGWTASLDPEGIAWKYCGYTRKFHPISDVDFWSKII
jgi:hypothetical protein